MILKDEQQTFGGVLEMWLFRIECDKCKAFAGIKMPTREQTQKFLYDSGWRVNSRARKYLHLCKTCGSKRRRRGE